MRKIGRRAFYRCKQLEELEFPEELLAVEEEAFYFTGLKELRLPPKLQIIGNSAFFKCNNLTAVQIPPSVRRIEKWAFHGCNRLRVVEILHDPEFIGEWITNKSTKIRCKRGSKVDSYCREYGLQTEYVENGEAMEEIH